MRPIPKICITGGPCAGKTSVMGYLLEKLTERGYYPIFVPEAATLLMRGNVLPAIWGTRDFQATVLRVMIGLEDAAQQAAEAVRHLNPIIVLDRGRAEVQVYAREEKDWMGALADNGIESLVAARDEYHAVFHLVTAANGAEAFFGAENNETRRESPAEARNVDDRTIAAWTGAPHLRIIDNSTDFEGKKKRLLQEICAFLGIPIPLEIERKFECSPVDTSRLPSSAQCMDIEQVYLFSDPTEQLRVRKRGQNGAYTYYRTQKRYISAGVNAETERRITAEEYNLSLQFQLPDTKPIRKTRICFVFENQYFELDMIPREDGSMLYLLEIELTDAQQSINLPPFIRIVREVTGLQEYSNAALARVA